jgi:hypothetical protein
MLTNRALSDALHAAGHSQFSDKSSTPKWNAQHNLEGRTHFADDATLRYFGSRILSAYDHDDGLLFTIIESSFADYAKTRRTFRFAVFDVFGTCIYRPDIEHGAASSKQARQALRDWLAKFDVNAHYAAAIAEHAQRAERDAATLRAML